MRRRSALVLVWAIGLSLGAGVGGCRRAPDDARAPAPPEASRDCSPIGTVPVCASTGTAPGQGPMAVPVRLPRPRFVGTPENIITPNLEPNRGGAPRPPVLVPPGCVNLALHRPVTANDPLAPPGALALVTDGNKEAGEQAVLELGAGRQHVQIDLGRRCRIHAVVLWHDHRQGQVHHDVIVRLADDPDFLTGVTTVFNNDHDNSAGLGVGADYEYFETAEGRAVAMPGVPGRYVRLYSNGSTAGATNQYTEVEVYGLPEGE